MDREEQILMTEAFVRQKLESYDSGHDWWHIVRVRKVALYINEMELLADPFEVDITALLHDTADSKFAGRDNDEGYQLIKNFMVSCGMSDIQENVIKVIKNVSFSSKSKNEYPDDPLLRVIQDADRLDAIGAIGIARAFNYGGFRNNKIYDPGVMNIENGEREFSKPGTTSTINHFYEKLLLLKSGMNTPTAKRLAEERHEFLEIFLNQFYKEWDFNSGSHP
jgi:uncharacterized protein